MQSTAIFYSQTNIFREFFDNSCKLPENRFQKNFSLLIALALIKLPANLVQLKIFQNKNVHPMLIIDLWDNTKFNFSIAQLGIMRMNIG